MKTDYDTPDGFHVGPDGVWDGQAATGEYGQNPGPGGVASESGKVVSPDEEIQTNSNTETDSISEQMTE